MRDLLNINEYPGSKWLVTQIKESLTKEDSVVVEVIPSSCLPKTPPIKIHIFSQTNQAMKSLFENLFEFEHPDSAGVKLYLLLFELFTVCYSVIYAWDWGLYILRIRDVVLPLGLSNYNNAEIFLGNNLPLLIAGLITLLATGAFFSTRYKWLYILVFLLLYLQYVTGFHWEKFHTAQI